ncbi:MAG: HU family DNA-binding protein [Defluviitaleaceae bacterium]|nr:HU family DNA-binding protein [Defluviitaleaceae bacterium]MCL2835765.1 HU family DNA-binding protein [Defluviitaleaceae bacterium]
MNKAELISAIVEKTGLTKKETEKTLKAFEEVVSEELVKGGKVQLVGFGTFDVSDRVARTGRNPQTGEPMNIEASKAPRFKAGKVLKDAVNSK